MSCVSKLGAFYLSILSRCEITPLGQIIKYHMLYFWKPSQAFCKNYTFKSHITNERCVISCVLGGMFINNKVRKQARAKPLATRMSLAAKVSLW